MILSSIGNTTLNLAKWEKGGRSRPQTANHWTVASRLCRKLGGGGGECLEEVFRTLAGLADQAAKLIIVAEGCEHSSQAGKGCWLGGNETIQGIGEVVPSFVTR